MRKMKRRVGKQQWPGNADRGPLERLRTRKQKRERKQQSLRQEDTRSQIRVVAAEIGSKGKQRRMIAGQQTPGGERKVVA